MLQRALWGAVALVLLACQDEPGADPAAMPSGTEVATMGPMSPNLLPAYRTEWEKKQPGKADTAAEFRKNHPQWFAITETPKVAGFRPMNEWEPMQANLITYSDYLPQDKPVDKTMVDIVVGSLPAGEVWVVVGSELAKATLLKRLKDAGVSDEEVASKVKFFFIENDAIWTIDFGPLPLADDAEGTYAFADFRYYPERQHDDAVPTRLANTIGVSTYRAPIYYEGGNFQADGKEFCYFSQRELDVTGMTFEQVQKIQQDYFGCKKSVLLQDISDDGTGHIDMFFKLCGEHSAVVGDYTVVNDPVNKKRMDENAALLTSLKYSDGTPGIKVFRIPMPHKKDGVPRTFINSTLYASADGSYKVNLWPIYTVDKDLEAEALEGWKDALPGWEHVGIISDQISLYSGAVHCVTRTIPALKPAKWVADGTCAAGDCKPAPDGYDLACIPKSEPDPGCWGPRWLCLCNNCSPTAGCTFPTSCGNGTCDANEGCLSCFDDCPCTGEDMACKLGTGKCVVDKCGNGVCNEDLGETCVSCVADCACPEGQKCSLAAKCIPVSCGDGACGAGENCSNCAKDCTCAEGEKCAMGVCTANPCGGIPFAGCCDGTVYHYCDTGALLTYDCKAEGCGWDPEMKGYDCGKAGEGPSNLPMDCYAYDFPPGCAGKQCGDNGAGYSCGTCPAGQTCSADFKCCQGSDCCEPACAGKECGTDGCGGMCGQCEAGETCGADGLCGVPVEPVPDAGPEVVAPDVVEVVADTGADGPVGDVAADTGIEEKKDDSGCSTRGSGTPGAMLLLLLAMAALGGRKAPGSGILSEPRP